MSKHYQDTQLNSLHEQLAIARVATREWGFAGGKPGAADAYGNRSNEKLAAEIDAIRNMQENKQAEQRGGRSVG